MRKTIKTTVAMLLAIIIACGSMTAFAAMPSEISWEFEWHDGIFYYSYGGELAVDETVTVEAVENERVYYELEVENDGYYKLSSTYNSTDFYRIAEKYENGSCYGELAYVSQGEFITDEYFYLEAGTHIVGTIFYGNESEEITVEYLGDIERFEFKDGAFDSLAQGKNLYIYTNDEGEIENRFEYTDGLKVVFTNGEEIVIDFVWLDIITEEKLEHGEYDVEIALYGFPYKEARTINVVDVTKVISKVEMTNIDAYTTIKYYYDYSLDYPYPENETVTVTYTDGTVEVVENFDGSAYLEKYGLWVESYIGYDYSYEYCYAFIISVSEVPFVTEECSLGGVSKIENIKEYNKENFMDIKDAFVWAGENFANIFRSGSLYDAWVNFLWFVRNGLSEPFRVISFVLKNTAELIGYMN